MDRKTMIEDLERIADRMMQGKTTLADPDAHPGVEQQGEQGGHCNERVWTLGMHSWCLPIPDGGLTPPKQGAWHETVKLAR